MDVIKNYLESMFASLPNTPDVRRAKQELLSMMEDKYTELITAGKAENEAIGIVISEFGNLDELAETLGIESVIDTYEEPTYRHVTLDEAKHYIADSAQNRFLIGLGVLLCITSPIGTILSDFFGNSLAVALGLTTLFVMIAVAVALFIYAAAKNRDWLFLEKEPCQIDYATSDYVYHEQQYNRASQVMQLVIGIALCIMCAVPTIIFDVVSSNVYLNDYVGPSILLAFIGIGVMMIICSGGRAKAYRTLLSLNDRATIAGNYEGSKGGKPHYDIPWLDTLMSVWKPTVTCLYLIWSFLTFKWYITWIIFPIAAIVERIIYNNMYDYEEDD